MRHAHFDKALATPVAGIDTSIAAGGRAAKSCPRAQRSPHIPKVSGYVAAL